MRDLDKFQQPCWPISLLSQESSKQESLTHSGQQKILEKSKVINLLILKKCLIFSARKCRTSVREKIPKAQVTDTSFKNRKRKVKHFYAMAWLGWEERQASAALSAGPEQTINHEMKWLWLRCLTNSAISCSSSWGWKQLE